MLVKKNISVGVLSYNVTAEYNPNDQSISLQEVLLITREKPLNITRDLDLWSFNDKPLYSILEDEIYNHCTAEKE